MSRAARSSTGALPWRWMPWLTRLSIRHPRRVLQIATSLALASLLWAAHGLELRTSNLDLIDPELPEVRRFRALAEELGTPNALVVVLEGDDPVALGRAVDRLGPRLATLPGVRSVVDRLPIPAAASELIGLDPWLASDDRSMFFLFVQPDDPESRATTLAPFVAAVRSELACERPGCTPLADGVHTGLTGMPAYALDDRETIERDLARLSVLSFVAVLFLFTTAFGALRRPLLAMLALLTAVAVVLGVATASPGHLTLLSAFFASILFGLGIDAGIHLLGRIEELRGEGLGEAESVERAVGDLAPGLLTSTLTTASVFLAMRFAGFRGFAELGTLAASGILLALLAMITVLPALLVLATQEDGEPLTAPLRRGFWLAALARAPRPATAAAAALVALAALLAPMVASPGFDTSYLSLQPEGSEAARLEKAMVEKSSWSPAAAIFLVDSRDEVKELTWRLIDEETVGTVRSLRDFEIFTGGGSAPLDLSDTLLRSFLGPSGRQAVYAYPAGDLWDEDEQALFLDRMRSLDPEVSGMPFLGAFMVGRSRRALRLGAAMGAILLLLWVALDLRRWRPTLLAILPAFLGLGALQGLMALFDLAWNPLNVMALPVVLGIAVDDGIHLVHRYRAESGDLAGTLAGTGRSIVLTSATNLAAFGSLVLSDHRGLSSFAAALCLGVLSALVITLVVLPPLLPWALGANQELSDSRRRHAARRSNGRGFARTHRLGPIHRGPSTPSDYQGLGDGRRRSPHPRRGSGRPGGEHHAPWFRGRS